VTAVRRPAVAGFLAGAALIAGLTVLARVTGFGRILVFSYALNGANCLSDVYQSANTVPNIIFEIVAGGVLASAVVPLLAGDVAAGTAAGAARAERTAGALLTWVVLLLVPLAVVVAVAAEPLAAAALGDKGCPGAVGVAASMLRVFAPQVVLYGVGIVLTGVLQAHRRFAGPALAPLLSSLVVIGAYLLYAVLADGHRGGDLGQLTAGEQAALSVGTTLGVVALTVPLLLWLRPTGLRLRPRLRFDPELTGRVRSLAAAGVGVLLAQQASVAVALHLSNDGVPAGYNTTLLYAQTVYLLPWAVLAVPIATAVFPRLAAAADARDRSGYAAALRPALRSVVLLSLLGTAVLVAAAPPVAALFLSPESTNAVDPGVLSGALVAFAPGLLGYGLVALLTRALFASGASRAATVATATGWLVVVAADLGLAAVLPRADRVAALAWGNSIGMTLAGALLVAATVRRAGPGALRGLGRTFAVGLAAAAVAAVAGRIVAAPDWGPDFGTALGQGMLSSTVVLVVFAAVVALGAREDLRAVTSRLRRGGDNGRTAGA
jgi:putative peptidoglycan lipid II flippase